MSFALTKDVQKVVTLSKRFKGISTSAILGLKLLVFQTIWKHDLVKSKMLINIETGAGLVATIVAGSEQD